GWAGSARSCDCDVLREWVRLSFGANEFVIGVQVRCTPPSCHEIHVTNLCLESLDCGPMRRLHHFALDPFSRKLRVLLREKNLAFDLIDERPGERRDELLHLN